MDYNNINDLNRLIENTRKIENVCDEIIEFLYYKHDKLPNIRIINSTISEMKGKKNLKQTDMRIFENLLKARRHLKIVGINTYIEVWALERHIPYIKTRAK